MNLHRKYLETLTPWLRPAAGEVFYCPDRPDLGYYGDGTNSWGVQTNQKALTAFAIAATDPLLDETAAGISRRSLLDAALACLRYSFASHKSGEYHLTNGPGERWGHTWISVLGIERMVFALDALEPYFTPEDSAALRRVFLSEADFLLDEYPILAGLVENNKPESNLWNGAFLLRAALAYPGAPRAALYTEKGTKLIQNAISVPSEADEPWFVGANFFESYATNHHRYMNVGYMVITLSQLAYLHFTYKRRGVEPPAVLYKNFEPLWALVRACIFPDGRLLRIGGDSRVRYCYCQDYLNMVLLLAADKLGADVAALEDGWLDIVGREQAENGDGTFLSTRIELFRERAPLYFARLEADRAVSAAQGAYLHRLWPSLGATGAIKTAVTEDFQWHDAYHGACFVRGRENMASFVWHAADLPQGMCLPLGDSSLAEWGKNLVSCFEGDGLFNEHLILEHYETLFPGGFVTTGRTLSRTWELLDESKTEEKNVELTLAFAALPDGATVVTMQYARAVRHCHLLGVQGLHLCVPNDLFNGYRREYTGDGRALCVDGRLGIASLYGDPLTIRRHDHRTVGFLRKHCYDRGMLWVDEVCTTLVDRPRWYERDECVLDFGTVLRAGADAEQTRTLAGESKALRASHPNVRAAAVPGRDGRAYTLAFNIGTADAVCTVEGCSEVTLAPCEAKLL